MSRADRVFALGTLLLTAAVPTTLAALQPFGEPRATLGVAAGWGAALLMMVPSYVLVSRSLARPGARGLLQGVLGGMLLRLVLTVGATLAFGLLVQDAPLKSFVLTFFAGYVLLTALELRLVVRAIPRGAST
jgi:hypothetical protein